VIERSANKYWVSAGLLPNPFLGTTPLFLMISKPSPGSALRMSDRAAAALRDISKNSIWRLQSAC